MDLLDVAAVEAAAASIDQIIERRAKDSEEANRIEAAWAESVRRHHARRREQNRWAWVRFFDRMARNHRELSEDYERRAEALCEEPGGGGVAS